MTMPEKNDHSVQSTGTERVIGTGLKRDLCILKIHTEMSLQNVTTKYNKHHNSYKCHKQV